MGHFPPLIRRKALKPLSSGLTKDQARTFVEKNNTRLSKKFPSKSCAAFVRIHTDPNVRDCASLCWTGSAQRFQNVRAGSV